MSSHRVRFEIDFAFPLKSSENYVFNRVTLSLLVNNPSEFNLNRVIHYLFVFLASFKIDSHVFVLSFAFLRDLTESSEKT